MAQLGQVLQAKKQESENAPQAPSLAAQQAQAVPQPVLLVAYPQPQFAQQQQYLSGASP